MNEESSGWIDFAHDDLRSAAVLYEAGIWNQVCFHSQQCVEKLLKALLTQQGAVVPRTHVIADLLNRLAAATRAAVALHMADLLDLDRYYMTTRYPDALPAVAPGEEEARRALDVARWATTIVEGLFVGGHPPNPPEAEQA